MHFGPTLPVQKRLQWMNLAEWQIWLSAGWLFKSCGLKELSTQSKTKPSFLPGVGALWSESCAEIRQGLSRRRDSVERLPRRLPGVFIAAWLNTHDYNCSTSTTKNTFCNYTTPFTPPRWLIPGVDDARVTISFPVKFSWQPGWDKLVTKSTFHVKKIKGNE